MARNPRKKAKPKARKGKKAPTRRVTNQNSVRVHVINNTGGGEAPPPYTGPDRGYFAFNPVFDMGLPKQASNPPMNTGVSIASAPVSRTVEASVGPDNPTIYEDWLERSDTPKPREVPSSSRTPRSTLKTRADFRRAIAEFGMPPPPERTLLGELRSMYNDLLNNVGP